MWIALGQISLELVSGSAAITADWADFFTGWTVAPASHGSIRVQLEITTQLPTPPAITPFFESRQAAVTRVTAYHLIPATIRLYLDDIAVIDVAADTADQAQGWITPVGLAQGRLEDATYQALAPLLRRRGYYLIHAACARYDQHAILLVGASGSGKTTTALNLALRGWEILANDVTLLQAQAGGVMALATPDQTVIRQPTLELLPELRAYVRAEEGLDRPQTANVLRLRPLGPRTHLPPTRVAAICFPRLGSEATSLTRCHQAVALARLLEESLDCWDVNALAAHTQCLGQLARQAPGYILELGRDIERLPSLLAGLRRGTA